VKPQTKKILSKTQENSQPLFTPPRGSNLDS